MKPIHQQYHKAKQGERKIQQKQPVRQGANHQVQSVGPSLLQQAGLPLASLTPGDVLQLQRAFGNQAVERRLVQPTQPQPITQKTPLSPLSPTYLPVARQVVQRCKTVEEVLGEEKDFERQKSLLLDYIEELDDSIGGFLADKTEDIYFTIADGLWEQLKQIKKGFKDLQPKTIGLYGDLIDGVTDEYRTLKDGSHPKLKKVGETDKEEGEGEIVATEVPSAFDEDIDDRDIKRLNLKGNSRPLKRSSYTLIEECAGVIRGLKQDLLSEAKAGNASITLTENYQRVKGLVVAKAQQASDDDIREYWTMKRGGLVAAIARAEAQFQEEVTCNEELAEWLGSFLNQKFQFF